MVKASIFIDRTYGKGRPSPADRTGAPPHREANRVTQPGSDRVSLGRGVGHKNAQAVKRTRRI